MKFILSTLAICTICISNLLADEVPNNLDAIDEKRTEASNEEAMLEMLGYLTVYRDGLKELGFGAKEADAIARGLKKALKDEVMDPSYQERMGEFQAFIEKKIKATQSIRSESEVAQLENNIKRGKEFIDGLAMDDAVKSTASGLHYKILKKGKSRYAKTSDTVRVHYKGTRIDGTVFDSSYKRGQPADFPLQGVVPGFSEGLTKVGEGGQIILFIPSDLAYGDNPMRGGVIQPGDTLIFECELIKINP